MHLHSKRQALAFTSVIRGGNRLRSSASLIAPIVLNEVRRRSSSQSEMVVIPNPASLAKSACDHPTNALAARTCFGVMECPVIET